ncbi:MAG: formate dehydrogenase accessory sulfurtransferase FdhD [Halanaerobium sp.]
MVLNNLSNNKNNIQNIDKNSEKTSGDKEQNLTKNIDIFEKKDIFLYKTGECLDKEDIIIKEFPLTIFINKYEFLTLMVLKENLEELIIGFLAAEGLIRDQSDITALEFRQNKKIAVVEIESDFNPERFKKRTLTSGCGSGSTFLNLKDCTEGQFIENKDKIEAEKIFDLMKKLQEDSSYFKLTGGTHISALAEPENILFRMEDIGRHNTLDKIIGKALKEEVNLDNKIILTSGRISSEMIIKVLRQGIPFLVSRSAPTDQAVNTAVKLGLTLIGFCRGRRMNIYSGVDRIIKN